MTDTAAPFGFTFGASHVQSHWSDFRRATWLEMVQMLTSHVPGPKEGSCIVPAKFTGTQRKKEQAERIDVVFLDSDGGATLDTITNALRARGWEAVVSSTHSHMTTRTKVAIRNWDRFFEKNPTATAEEFLVAEKDYLPAVAAGAVADETIDDLVYLTHQPCPKFRIVIPLEQPWLAASYDSQAAANAAWKERIEALAAALGLSHDQSCTDTSRLFYLPRHPGNGVVPETAVVTGKHCDIFALQAPTPEPSGLFGTTAKRSAPLEQREFVDPVDGEIIDLTEWAKQFGGTFMVAKALKARKPGVITGHVADSRVHIDCPNAGAHTDPARDGATYCINGGSSATKGFVIHCRHAHCADKDRLSFVHDMLGAGWLSIVDLTDPDFHGAAETAPPKAAKRSRQHDTGIAWGPPVDFLSTEATGAPILREEHAPASLWPFVVDVSQRLGVDPYCVLLNCLAAVATVMSDDWEVQPKRHDTTWVEQARIWIAVVGDPSILKTPVLSACTSPIDKLEIEARKQHAEAIRQWDQDCLVAKLDKQVPPPRPRCDRYMVEGTTTEALSEVLRDDEEAKFRTPAKKVMVRQDELTELFGNLDRYKAGGKGGGDRAVYLKLYNGGRNTIDRVGRGSFAVPHWSATFAGGIQPGPIQKIARDAADDGMLQRFMLAVPSHQGRGVDRAANHDAIRRYHALFPALIKLHPIREIGFDYVRAVTFAEGAHAYREQINDLATAMSSMPDASLRIKSTFGKWAGLFARLCLIYHLVEIADAQARGDADLYPRVITAGTAARVAALMEDIVLPHMLRADTLMYATEQTGHARWIAGFILARQLSQIEYRDIARSYKALKSPEAKADVLSVMDNLSALGWVHPDEPAIQGKHSTRWFVNPSVHEAFAERREAEASRREQAKRDLADAFERIRARKVRGAKQ